MTAGRDEFPLKVRRAIWERDGGRCVVCGSTERLIFEHILPCWLGGRGTVENGELRCEACARPKTAREAGERARSNRLRDGKAPPRNPVRGSRAHWLYAEDRKRVKAGQAKRRRERKMQRRQADSAIGYLNR